MARQDDAVRLAEIEVFNYRLFFYPIVRTDAFFFGELNVPDLANEYAGEPERIAQTAIFDDGVVKGFVRVNGTEIEKLFVEPSFQNQGVGEKLLSYAIDTLGGKRLWVLEKNLRAIRFYERHGFRLTERKQRLDDTSEYLIQMER